MRFDGKLAVPRGAVRSASVQQRRAGSPVVYIETLRGTPIEVSVESRADGDRLVEALGLPSEPVVPFARLSIGAPWKRDVPGLLLVMVGLFARLEMGMTLLPVALFILIGWALAVAGRQFGEARVTAGTDGLYVDRVFPKGIFVPFTAIADLKVGVSARAPTVTLRTHAGRSLPLSFPGPYRDPECRAGERDELVRRIGEGMSRPATRTDGEEVHVDRGDRSTSAWLRFLREASRGAGYRTGVVAERLWALVEDPRAQASVRGAVAAAFAPTLDDNGRERLRVAARASAEPQLRRVLAASADGADEQNLEDALDVLEKHESRAFVR